MSRKQAKSKPGERASAKAASRTPKTAKQSTPLIPDNFPGTHFSNMPAAFWKSIFAATEISRMLMDSLLKTSAWRIMRSQKRARKNAIAYVEERIRESKPGSEYRDDLQGVLSLLQSDDLRAPLWASQMLDDAEERREKREAQSRGGKARSGQRKVSDDDFNEVIRLWNSLRETMPDVVSNARVDEIVAQRFSSDVSITSRTVKNYRKNFLEKK